MPLASWATPTVASLALTWTITQSVRQIRRERRTDRRTDPEKIAAWTGPHIDDCEFVKQARDEDEWWVGHHAHSVVIRNGSPQPMFDVVLGVAGVDGAIEDGSDYVTINVGLVPPEVTETRELPCRAHHVDLHQVAVDIMFTDPRGVRWARDAKGRLRKHKPPA